MGAIGKGQLLISNLGYSRNSLLTAIDTSESSNEIFPFSLAFSIIRLQRCLDLVRHPTHFAFGEGLQSCKENMIILLAFHSMVFSAWRHENPGQGNVSLFLFSNHASDLVVDLLVATSVTCDWKPVQRKPKWSGYSERVAHSLSPNFVNLRGKTRKKELR